MQGSRLVYGGREPSGTNLRSSFCADDRIGITDHTGCSADCQAPQHWNPIVWIAAPVVVVLVILGIVALGSSSTGAQNVASKAVTALRQGDVTTRSSLPPTT
jgi:hypothetical protein